MIYDDRAVSAGFMFADADLLGVPYRLIVSPRNLKDDCIELVSRDKSLQIKLPKAVCADELEKIILENK